uniref:hypothetical protein n=1 Tax=Okeania sp. SIO2F4 TaxID=2607790 RepID=UPI0025D52622
REKFSTCHNQKFHIPTDISIFIGKFSLSQSKTKRGFFPTAEISERGKTQKRKIQHLPQPKISHPHRYIYIYRKIFTLTVKDKKRIFPHSRNCRERQKIKRKNSALATTKNFTFPQIYL